MMGEEEPQTATQRVLKELHKQQKEITWENVIKELYAHDFKVSTDIKPQIYNPFKPEIIHWLDACSCPNPLKKFPEDGEIHINIKKRDIKFNFKN